MKKKLQNELKTFELHEFNMILTKISFRSDILITQKWTPHQLTTSNYIFFAAYVELLFKCIMGSDINYKYPANACLSTDRASIQSRVATL